MTQETFKLIDAVNREGIDNGMWGLVENIEDTSTYFGTTESISLQGYYLYIYREPDDIRCYTDKFTPTHRFRLSENAEAYLEVYKLN